MVRCDWSDLFWDLGHGYISALRSSSDENCCTGIHNSKRNLYKWTLARVHYITVGKSENKNILVNLQFGNTYSSTTCITWGNPMEKKK
nr:hypothetical protein Iba_chr13cCG8230 [Ipomoea batatas]